MSRMRSLIFAILLAVVSGGPALAKPGDGACLWRNTPGPVQKRLVAAYAKGAMEQIVAVSETMPWLDQAMASCGVDAAKRVEAADLWGIVGYRAYLLGAVASRSRNDEATVEAALKGVSAETRAALADSMTGGSDDPNATAAAFSTVEQLAERLGLGAEALDLLVGLIATDHELAEMEAL